MIRYRTPAHHIFVGMTLQFALLRMFRKFVFNIQLDRQYLMESGFFLLKMCVNNINIYGNTRTKEKVIRREITFVEGDPYNEGEISKTKNNLRNLNYFKTIVIKDKEIDNQVDINIEVDTNNLSSKKDNTDTPADLLKFL